jgi:DNA-binding beta-propeller fold protein YncE
VGGCRLRALLAALAGSLLFAAALPGAAAPSGLRQLAGAEGCVYDPAGGSERGLHEDLLGSCGTAAGLDGAYVLTASANGRHLYVGSFAGDAISVFTRDARTGAVRQSPLLDACVVDAPADRRCGIATALDGVSDLVLSPDGRHLYAASFMSHSITVFERDPATGGLTQSGSLATCPGPGFELDPCGEGRELSMPTSVAVSPDGRHVYAAAIGSDAIAVLARDRSTGLLRQLDGAAGCLRELPDDWPAGLPDPAGCAPARALSYVSSVTVTSDGRFVYAASFGSSAVAVFARTPATGVLTQLPGARGCVSEGGSGGDCAAGRGLQGAFSVDLSPDGRTAYVSAGFDVRRSREAFETSGVAVFSRRPDGSLHQLPGRAGCVSETGSRGACADGLALAGSAKVAVSPDGGTVYVAATASDAVAVFARDRATGAVRQLPGRSGCVSETATGGACTDGVGLWGVAWVLVSPDGRFVYAPGYYASALTVFSRPALAARRTR